MRFFVLLLLGGCATQSYTNSCPEADILCQTNLNAQTLYLIGEIEDLWKAFDEAVKNPLK
jgi:hypothetical protein